MISIGRQALKNGKLFIINLSLIISYFPLDSIAQVSNDFTGSSGKTAIVSPGSLQEVNNNVNLSLGSITPTIPIVQIKSGSLTTSVSLVNTGCGGIRVNEYASRVGLGWEISAGGYIKRTIRGKKDDMYFSQGNNNRGWLDPLSGSYPNDVLLNSVTGQNYGAAINKDYECWVGSTTVNDINPARQRHYYNSIHQNTFTGEYDTEPDIFEFNFSGISGSFVFDGEGKPVLIPYQNIEILPVMSSNGITGWTCTTSDGIKYLFNISPEKTQIVSNTGIEDDPLTNYIDESKIETEYNSTWYLSRIDSPFGDFIKFTYYVEQQGYLTFQYNSDSKTKYISGAVDIGPAPSATNFDASEINSHIITTVKVIYPMYLQKIEGINESITFENDVNPRTDLGQNINFYPLKFVKLHRKNLRNINQPILLKEFQFNYSYFFNSPRLKLMSLQQNCVGTDCLNVKPLIYRFKYSTTLLPKIDDLAKDLWGFYNANEISWVSSGYSGFPSFSINDPIAGLVSNISGETKAPNYENSSGGILSEIIYPNSSSVSYQYESNQLSNIGSVGGFRIKKIVTKENFLQPSILDNVTEYVYNSGDKDYRDNPNNFYKLNKFYQFHLNCGSSGQPPCSERDFARLFYTINTEINSFYSRDYIRYTNVSEIHPGNGSINYEYTGFQSNPNALPEKRTFQYWLNPNISNYLETNSTAILGNKTDFSYERGLLKAMTIFDKDGNLVKKIENVWEFNPVGYVPKQVVGLSVFVSNFFKMITTGPPTIYELEFYKHVSKWFYISSTIETTFDRSNSGKKLSIITNYHYNATTKDIDYIKSSNSDGSETFKYFKYINDYPEITSNMIGLNGMSEGIRQCLIKKMNFPVQTITTKK
jgi:hypothetical protein